jgi:hypothetical protein
MPEDDDSGKMTSPLAFYVETLFRVFIVSILSCSVFLPTDMIPSADDDDDDNEAEFFQESFQTNAELLVASSEHDSMFDRILGPFRAKSSSQKQILVLEQIIRLFLFVILLRWKEEPERLSQPSNETTCSTKDPGRHTTTTTKTSTPSTL